MAVLDKNKLLGKKENGGALVVRPKANLVPSKSLSSDIAKVEPVQESPTLVIKTKVIKIEDLLKGTLALEKKEAEDKRKELEEEKRQKQEDQIEGAPKTKEKKFRMPVPKKVTSFFDDIKRYIGTVLMGWLVVRLVKFLPKIIPILKLLANVADFLIKWGGIFLDGLVTLVDKGYEAFEKTSEWIGDVFGEDKQKEFEKFAGVFTKFLNVALVAAMVGAKAGMLGMGGGPRRGIVNKGKRLIKKAKRFFDPKRAAKLKRLKNIKKIRADKLVRVKKFGRLKKFAKAKKLVGKGINLGKNIVKTGGKVAQTATKGVKTAVKTATPVIKSATKTATKVAKTATKTATTAAKTTAKTATKLAKTGLKTGLKGLKALKKVVSPIVKKIPFIGALLDFVLNYFVFKEPLGRAAFMAIGAGLAAWLGGIIGSVIPVGGTLVGAALGGWAGDKLAGALYDAIFKEKKPKEDKKKKTTKMQERNKEGYYSMLSSGKKDKIEQALYELRINSIKTGEAHSDMVGNPKYAGDVDLIMKHGMQKVEIDRGRVKLQGNAENIIPLDVNSVAKKTNNISSYDDEEETIVIKSGSETGGDVAPETQIKESLAPVVVGGGGGSREIDEALYKSG